MIKLILLTVAFSLAPIAAANTDKEASKPATDMSSANKAHAAIKSDEKANQPFWSKDQVKQSELEVKYKKAITDNPDDKKSLAYLAGLYLSNNKTGKAIDAYQDAITVDAENPKLFAALSIAYLHHSKYEMAQAMADEALRLDPKMKGVDKISEYVIAKQEAIKAASEAPAEGEKIDMSKGGSLHGTLAPVGGAKPSDKIHNPKK